MTGTFTMRVDLGEDAIWDGGSVTFDNWHAPRPTAIT